jgi:dipeptide/tripeptide permease
MERFAQYVVAGGLALVAGLWATSLASQASARWLLGVALAALGAVTLSAGIWREVTV